MLCRLGEWCNGSTADSGSACLGSNPSSPANQPRFSFRERGFFLVMLRALVIFLLLVAVGIQTLPLRVCAVEQALAGRSCHDNSGALVEQNDAQLIVDNGPHGHAATDGKPDRTCRCEMPKGGVDRHVPPDSPLDLVPAQAAPLDLGLVLVSAAFVPTVEQPPNVAAASVSLPLLI